MYLSYTTTLCSSNRVRRNKLDIPDQQPNTDRSEREVILHHVFILRDPLIYAIIIIFDRRPTRTGNGGTRRYFLEHFGLLWPYEGFMVVSSTSWIISVDGRITLFLVACLTEKLVVSVRGRLTDGMVFQVD
jgi:hypothetical protein